ncbi:MAG TPA: ADYC domain-containing protein, partial [Polyangia bacterium]|nr:ADYC domain-containing protein [Polyangia bacterium]
MADHKGVAVSSVEIRGGTATSAIEPHELTARAGISTGSGSYIAVGGASVVGRYAVAHLVDGAGNPAEDLDLYIAEERPDPKLNLLHRGESQDNDDVTLYTPFFFHKWSGQWASLCPFDPLTGGASAIALAEEPVVAPKKFFFACTATGVASKCARNWGYAPWRTEKTWLYQDATTSWVEQSFELKPFYDACKTAARAAYCQDEKSFTKNGTLVDLYDTRQFIWPNAIENPLNELNDDSRWMFAQEYFVSFDHLISDPALNVTALQRTRYRELSPVGECANFATVGRLEHDHFEDGRWASPLIATPRVEVFSPNYCTHSENQPGEALPWDCSPCTKAICRTMPRCCSPDPTLAQPVWDALCVAERLTACRENPLAPLWPLGKVWPRDLPPAPPKSPLKYLLGPGGVVDRVDGISAAATSATVSGWACDPEWPGAAVSVAIYGTAPRDQAGSVFLGETRAELAIPLPLAREVSAACDGPNRSTARHGFSFTLPAGHTGNVFAYALDRATADGPASPPALLRNGIVHVPTCPHSEFVVGTALDPTCSPCVDSVCDHAATADCCTTGWTEACAQAAEVCAPQNLSASANERAFAAVATGWIEAPVSGPYTFESSRVPSRLFVNGKKLVDWWDGPGPTSGNIDLVAGGKYHVRWDRFHSAPPPGGGDAGLTWRAPGSAVQATIPATLLYRLAPGIGTGLLATYYDGLNLTGASVARVDGTP